MAEHLIDALYALARQRGRNANPLLALRTFAGRPGARISHLPIQPALAQGWPGATGEPFHQHQALALAALRRDEALALTGGLSARRTMQLLLLEALYADATATALLVAPDELAAMTYAHELSRLLQSLRQPLQVGLATGSGVRSALSANIVVATPELLHNRLLRHHDRAWAHFWAKLRMVVLAEVHAYPGTATVHLAALLLRLRRLVVAPQPIQLMATLAPVAGAATALAQISALPWRILSAEDAPSAAAAIALWRNPGERPRETLALALGLARTNARVHLLCPAFEAPLLRLLAGADFPTLSIGPSMLPADVQVIMGLNEAAVPLAQARDGASLTVLVLGDDPAERALARLATSAGEAVPLLDDPPPQWIAAAVNAYIEAQHLLCAASERPLSANEADAWGVTALIERLCEQQRLICLPGNTPLWQPLPTAGDVYAGFDLHAAGGLPALIADDQGHPLGILDQATFDRWGFLGAALPPLRGGYRVVERNDDDERLALTISANAETRRTIPLRHCTIHVRDRREYRTLRGCDMAWGRVIVDEELYGFREAAPSFAPHERVINPPIHIRWSAPALWIDLPMAVKAPGQLIGWSLVAALPLYTTSRFSDVVPAYDNEVYRIYFVDTQPGGNGMASWLFNALESILPLAYDIALECRTDPLLEPLARADMDWLLSLLGGRVSGAPPPAMQPDDPPATPTPLQAQTQQQFEDSGHHPPAAPSTSPPTTISALAPTIHREDPHEPTSQ
ncbi:MAG: helicase, partial [Candidatus Viridilinea halotolerans]